VTIKTLVIGGSGMLGSDVRSALEARGHDVWAPSSGELDLTSPESVAEIALRTELNWCVNCAAYTAVDKAESEEQEATELNAIGPGYLARACAMAGIKLLHVSTDFVFDGNSSTPYTEEDTPNPVGVYGRTKLAGEEAIRAALPTALVLRTSWLYGPLGKSFPKTMISAWRAGKALKVVADQVGCPTSTDDLSRVIVDAVEYDLFPGIYHASGPEAMTWHDFATRAIEGFMQVKDIDGELEIMPIRTEDWPTPAARPPYSVLSNSKICEAGIAPMRNVGESLRDFCLRLELG
jgi:dTDP-4-dehydrorhamnose reductase